MDDVGLSAATPGQSGRRRWRWTADFGDHPEEPAILEELLEARVAATLPRKDRDEALRRHKAFLHYRFGGHLRNYRTFGGKYAMAFGVLSVAIIVAGLASSGIAAGWSNASWARWTILSLGLVGGVAAAVNQIWRPGEKGASRMKGANMLCAEAYAYLERRGRYHPRRSGEDGAETFGLFVDEVLRIIQQAAVVDEANTSAPSEPAQKT
jgi:hypothetical protein